MDQHSPPAHQNRLLGLLALDDLAALSAGFEPVSLSRGAVLIRANKPIESIVFPDAGIVSIVSITDDKRRIEVGIFGREGMADGSLLAGVDRVPFESFVQVAGHGRRITTKLFLQALLERPNIAKLLLRYAHVFGIQVAQTALANSNYSLEQRLARWLLMCQDRVDGDEVPLTHEFLGIMLAVRRSGVTKATQMLQGNGVINARRGHITILDRTALIALAGSSYGLPEAEYERIMGIAPS